MRRTICFTGMGVALVVGVNLERDVGPQRLARRTSSVIA